jgi:hypothetical protein
MKESAEHENVSSGRQQLEVCILIKNSEPKEQLCQIPAKITRVLQ